LGVLVVEVDGATWFGTNLVDECDKKRAALGILWEGLRKAVALQCWDLAPFADTRERVLGAGIENEWIWKSKWSPGKRWQAVVVCRHEVCRFEAVVDIRDRSGNVVRQGKLLEDVPSEFSFAGRLGSLRWVGRDEV
jgi:hypothetical protein